MCAIKTEPKCCKRRKVKARGLTAQEPSQLKNSTKSRSQEEEKVQGSVCSVKEGARESMLE